MRGQGEALPRLNTGPSSLSHFSALTPRAEDFEAFGLGPLKHPLITSLMTLLQISSADVHSNCSDCLNFMKTIEMKWMGDYWVTFPITKGFLGGLSYTILSVHQCV